MRCGPNPQLRVSLGFERKVMEFADYPQVDMLGSL
jgi:hypothetical protein